MDEGTKLPLPRYRGYFVVANLVDFTLEVRLYGFVLWKGYSMTEVKRWIDDKVEADSLKTKEEAPHMWGNKPEDRSGFVGGSSDRFFWKSPNMNPRLEEKNARLEEALTATAKALKCVTEAYVNAVRTA